MTVSDPPVKYTGDPWTLLATVRDGNNALVDMSGLTVKYSLVSSDKNDVTVLIAEKTASEVDPNADFTNGVAALTFTDAETSAVDSYGLRYIELQVDGTTAKNRYPIEVKRES